MDVQADLSQTPAPTNFVNNLMSGKIDDAAFNKHGPVLVLRWLCAQEASAVKTQANFDSKPQTSNLDPAKVDWNSEVSFALCSEGLQDALSS